VRALALPVMLCTWLRVMERFERKRRELRHSSRLEGEELNHRMPAAGVIDRRILLPFARFLASTSKGSRTRWFWSFALFLVILGGVMYRIGFPVISVLPWDIAIQLDGAWRIVHGQVPRPSSLPLLESSLGPHLPPASLAEICCCS
jgi:hypothetical protein